MDFLLHRQNRHPSRDSVHSRAWRYFDDACVLLLLAALCFLPLYAFAGNIDPAIELGADNFDIELASAKAPELIDSTVPALRAAIILQRDEGLAFKQTLIYGNGTSIQGRAWQTDTRLGYRNHLTEYLIFEPLVSLGVISITPNYQMANESNVKTKYAMAGTRLELATHFISLAADGQIGRNIDPVITNVTCTPGVSFSAGVEASAKYFGGKLVVGADRKKMPMGNGYRFEVAHIYAGYRLEF